MKTDVFISYSTIDFNITNQIRESFEKSGINCWIAPRNIRPGMPFAHEIVDAIISSQVMLLVYSKDANDSNYVLNEVTQAAKYKKIIIPFLIDDSTMSPSLDFYLSSFHWFNGFPDYRNRIKELVELVKQHIIVEKDEQANEQQNDSSSRYNKPDTDIFKSSIWDAAIEILSADSELDISKVMVVSNKIIKSEGYENSLAFWTRLIDENDKNPLYYSGRAKVYEQFSKTKEDYINIIKDYSKAYSLSYDNTKYNHLKDFYWYRLDDARCDYYREFSK